MNVRSHRTWKRDFKHAYEQGEQAAYNANHSRSWHPNQYPAYSEAWMAWQNGFLHADNPERKWYMNWKTWLVVLVLIALLAGLYFLGYQEMLILKQLSGN